MPQHFEQIISAVSIPNQYAILYCIDIWYVSPSHVIENNTNMKFGIEIENLTINIFD